MASTPGKMEETNFPLFLSLRTTKCLTCETKYKKTLKGREKKADQLGPRVLRI